MKRIQTCLLISLMVFLSSCKTWWSNDDEENNPFKGMSAEQLYIESQKDLQKGEYLSAIKRLEAIESMYPFSDYTENSQLDLINAYYKNEDYPSAAATAERFIRLYPRAKHVDYAYYMRGLANFQQDRGIFAKVLPLDESFRDPGTQLQSYTDFSVFIQKFPESKYKANALQRMIYLRNMFAAHELHVASFYLKRKMYVAAIERASYLVKNYPQAPSLRAALAVLYDANIALGLNKAAEEVMAVYKETYGSTKIKEPS